MKQQKRVLAFAIAFVMLLTPALALAIDPNNVDISKGDVKVDSTNTTQKLSSGVEESGAHGGNPVTISDSSGSQTENNVTIDSSGGSTPHVTISDVSFAGASDPSNHEASLVIKGGGAASADLENVDFSGDNPAISVEGGGTANFKLEGVSADISGGGAAISVNDTDVNIDVNGSNTVESEGAGLSASNTKVTVTGDGGGGNADVFGDLFS